MLGSTYQFILSCWNKKSEPWTTTDSATFSGLVKKDEIQIKKSQIHIKTHQIQFKKDKFHLK